MADVEILELAKQIERVITALSEGLKTGNSEGQEIKVALAKSADESALLKGANAKKNLDDIYSDVDSKIKNLVVNPSLAILPDGNPNANFHQNISAYLQGVFKDSVVNETYARVVGNSDQYPDGDKILNTFKELQTLIGTDSAKAVDAASILSRLSQLAEDIATARRELEVQISGSAQQFQQSLTALSEGFSQAGQNIIAEIEGIKSDISTFKTNNDLAHSDLTGQVSSAKGELDTKITTVKEYAEGVQLSLDGLGNKYGAFVASIGSAQDFVVARQKLENLSIKRIWG